MGRYDRKRKTKTRSEAQIQALEANRKRAHISVEDKENTPILQLKEENIHLKNNIKQYQQKSKEQQKKYWNEYRKNYRLQKASQARKVDLKNAKADARWLRGALALAEKKACDVKKAADETTLRLQARIHTLEKACRDLQQKRTVLWKRCRRLESALRSLKDRGQAKSRRHPALFKMTSKGVYTAQARALARMMVMNGMAEAKVGKTLQEIGEALGVKIERKMSKRTIRRVILEAGVAADIQAAYEMVKAGKITFSSDSTSHKHIEYESRAIALEVIDYSDPNAEPKWKLRTLGVGTSINHTSQTQVDGLRRRLEELAEVFNNSPLAKRETLHFTPDDFAYKLIGTSSDHAADQKKSHEILRVWRMEVIMLRLGEEAVLRLGAATVLSLLIPLKAKQIEDVGGQEAWDKLTDEEKRAADILLIREIGQEVFDGLPDDEQERLTRFIRTGCCMHKDLNANKGGDKAMQDMWKKLGKTPPILLANRDNAAVLENITNAAELTPAEKRAEDVSKRGGSKAVSLGGLICRHKDKKKGQQDTYDWYMQVNVGQRVPFPDVSNTRYGSHGEAAAVILVYLAHFIRFMEFVRDGKDKPGFTNIELNFYNALKNRETLTELCVLALYNVSVSRPFMQHVRSHENLLDLGPFFQTKAKFLESISLNPKLWTGSDGSHVNACLGGREWDKWEQKVVDAVRKLAPSLPDLDDAVKAYVDGAREVFTERFSDEFKDGSDIDRLTANERSALFFPSTNDINEGGLGRWRVGQRLKPAETLNKFDATLMTSQNDTEAFIKYKLAQEEDFKYLREMARKIDGSGLQKKLKEEQMRADAQKVADSREKDVRRQEKRDQRAAVIAETSKNLVLAAVDIENLKLEELNRQLDYHRAEEKKIHGTAYDTLDADHKVPLKSHMKNKDQRTTALKKAVERHLARVSMNHPESAAVPETVMVVSSREEDMFYESDNDDYE